MSEESKKLLSALMVMGAQSPERALGAEELAGKLGMDARTVETELNSLVDAGYADSVGEAGSRRVFLTGTGVITASSTYS
jgi:DNA-binding MarR family transcriptional regulator